MAGVKPDRFPTCHKISFLKRGSTALPPPFEIHWSAASVEIAATLQLILAPSMLYISMPTQKSSASVSELVAAEIAMLDTTTATSSLTLAACFAIVTALFPDAATRPNSWPRPEKNPAGSSQSSSQRAANDEILDVAKNLAILPPHVSHAKAALVDTSGFDDAAFAAAFGVAVGGWKAASAAASPPATDSPHGAARIGTADGGGAMPRLVFNFFFGGVG